MKRLVVAGIAVFVAWSLLDALTHRLLLEPLYASSAGIWRPFSEMNPVLIVAVTVLLIVVFLAGYSDQPCSIRREHRLNDRVQVGILQRPRGPKRHPTSAGRRRNIRKLARGSKSASGVQGRRKGARLRHVPLIVSLAGTNKNPPSQVLAGLGKGESGQGGENGIRTRDAGFPTYRISNPALSAAQPSLRRQIRRR